MSAIRLEPRSYQKEAVEWALSEKRATVCMPTGTGKTLIAGLWIRQILPHARGRVLVLEPTRFLVEQVARFLREVLGLDAAPLHGSLPHQLRMRGLAARVIVATPELWVSLHREGVLEDLRVGALVVDECHHTTGKDAYVEAVKLLEETPYRLGLSAFIPPSRRRFIEEWIGPVRCWDWSHPKLRRYMPAWVGEVYEAPFNNDERELYSRVEGLWEASSGRARMLLGLALRWLSRDGAGALRESYNNSPNIKRLLEGLEDLLFHNRVRNAHKLDALKRTLADHESLGKTIVFIDRVSLARLVARVLEEEGYRTVLLLGRRRSPSTVLEEARDFRTDVIVSTSAGEEGIDLPEAGLLVVWSNTASPLRFIQRLGRLLRPRGGGGPPKAAVFIVTPDTIDVDSLLDAIVTARAAGVDVNVGEDAVRHLIELSHRRRILGLLANSPLTPDAIAGLLQAPLKRVLHHLRWLRERGLVGYIHTELGKVYFLLNSPYMLRSGIFARYVEGPTNILLIQSFKVTCTRQGMSVSRRGSTRDLKRVISHIARSIEREGPCKSLRVSVTTKVGYVIYLDYITYDFPVDSRELLEILLLNALWKASVRR